MDETRGQKGGDTHYTAYRFGSKDPRRQRDAIAAFPFFALLPKYLDDADVVFGPDPPDFVIHAGAFNIGVEVTQLNPKPQPRSGFKARGHHENWLKKNPTKSFPSDGRKTDFNWGTFTLRESLDALDDQLASKAAALSRYASNYAENWLLLKCQEGSPFGELAESSHLRPDSYRGDLNDFFAKETFEVASLLASRPEFTRIILFSGGGFVSAKNGQSCARLPTFDSSLKAKGAELGNEMLNWRFTLKSSRWRESQ